MKKGTKKLEYKKKKKKTLKTIGLIIGVLIILIISYTIFSRYTQKYEPVMEIGGYNLYDIPPTALEYETMNLRRFAEVCMDYEGTTTQKIARENQLIILKEKFPDAKKIVCTQPEYSRICNYHGNPNGALYVFQCGIINDLEDTGEIM